MREVPAGNQSKSGQDNHMKYDRWATVPGLEGERVREREREIVARSCCDCPQNGTINVAYPFSQIVAQQKDARLQLLNTVNKCQCPFPPFPLSSLAIPPACSLPCPFIDNIMTFRIIFQIVKKLNYFFLKTKIEIVLSVGGAVRLGPFRLWLTAGVLQHIGVLIMTFYWFFALSPSKVLLSSLFLLLLLSLL